MSISFTTNGTISTVQHEGQTSFSFDQTGLKNVSVDSLNGGPLAGFRNRIINGNFIIGQRWNAFNQTLVAGADMAYGIDRWYAYCTGANVSGYRIGTYPLNNHYQFNGAGGVTKIGVAQRIESFNCIDLGGQTVTLSVELSNSLLTTVTWTARYANNANSFGTLASPNRTQFATGTFTVSATLNRYIAQITVPTVAATNGIEIEFSVGAQTSGNWVIGNVQLERGSVATPFEIRHVPFERFLCQRYFYRQNNWNGMIVGGIATAAGQQAHAMYRFPVEMLNVPTVTGLSNWNRSNATVPDAVGVSEQGFRISVQSQAAGEFYAVPPYSEQGASGIFASAEL